MDYYSIQIVVWTLFHAVLYRSVEVRKAYYPVQLAESCRSCFDRSSSGGTRIVVAPLVLGFRRSDLFCLTEIVRNLMIWVTIGH